MSVHKRSQQNHSIFVGLYSVFTVIVSHSCQSSISKWGAWWFKSILLFPTLAGMLFVFFFLFIYAKYKLHLACRQLTDDSKRSLILKRYVGMKKTNKSKSHFWNELKDKSSHLYYVNYWKKHWWNVLMSKRISIQPSPVFLFNPPFYNYHSILACHLALKGNLTIRDLFLRVQSYFILNFDLEHIRLLI